MSLEFPSVKSISFFFFLDGLYVSVGQRLAIVVSCVILYLMTTMMMDSKARDACLALVILLACLEKLCSVLNLVSVERDWVSLSKSLFDLFISSGCGHL